MTFKEQIASDNRKVFAHDREFWDKHMIAGKEMLCMVDNNELIDREKRYQYSKSKYADGIYLKQLLIYVHQDDFGPMPAIGRMLTFDGKSYIVCDSINENGIYSITMEANKT